MKNKLLLTFIIISNICFSQNLVPNPSFEEKTDCPKYSSDYDYIKHWGRKQIGWVSYFHKCAPITKYYHGVPRNCVGFQEARTGDAYASFYSYTEPGDHGGFLNVKLKETLKKGKTYYAECYLSLVDDCTNSTSNFGFYFSEGPIRGNFSFSATTAFEPQIKNPDTAFFSNPTIWEHFSGTYVAKGGENYLLIGSFIDKNGIRFSNNNKSRVSYYTEVSELLFT